MHTACALALCGLCVVSRTARTVYVGPCVGFHSMLQSAMGPITYCACTLGTGLLLLLVERG